MREVVTAKGSRFLLCRLSQENPAYPKYPPQPVVRCDGYCKNLTLAVLADHFAICKLSPTAPIPAWSTAGDFLSITRTADELSVVCPQDAVPEGIACEREWRCLRVVGTLPFSVIGVLASLTAPLADAGISVFAISTFDTDYILVRATDLGRALDVLKQQGHLVQ